MDINTKADWWALLRNNMQGNFEETFSLIYQDTEKYYALVKAVEGNDHDGAHNILEAAWMDAPDSGRIHGWPGWGSLCDLCSEYWVFEPEEPNVPAVTVQT